MQRPTPRHFAVPVLLLALLTSLAALPAFADVEVRRLDESYTIAAGGTLELEVPVAEIRIEGTHGNTVSLEMTVECDRRSGKCADRAEDLRFESRTDGGDLELRLEGYSKSMRKEPQVHLVVYVPRDRAVELELGVGDLKVSGLENDLRIELGVGGAKIEMAESHVRSVQLEVGVGEADLRPERSSKRSGFLGFLGNEVKWDAGKGDARLRIEVGVGEARVELG